MSCRLPQLHRDHTIYKLIDQFLLRQLEGLIPDCSTAKHSVTCLACLSCVGPRTGVNAQLRFALSRR